MNTPNDLEFYPEFRRVVYLPSGERDVSLDSRWYDDFRMATYLLNDEFPEPTPTGYRFQLQVRWVSEIRPAAIRTTDGLIEFLPYKQELST